MDETSEGDHALEPEQDYDWLGPVHWLTLRFKSDEANRLFNKNATVDHFAAHDRVLCCLSVCSTIVVSTKIEFISIVEVMMVVVACLCSVVLYTLARMPTPAVKQLYIKYRLAVTLAFRMNCMIGGKIAHEQLTPRIGDINATGWFPSTLLQHNGCLLLATAFLGHRLLFWQHLLTLPFVLAFLWGPGTVSIMTDSLCKHYPAEIRAAYDWFEQYTTFLQRASYSCAVNLEAYLPTWVQDSGVHPTRQHAAGHLFTSHSLSSVQGEVCTAYCPAIQVVSFLQFFLGIILPCVLLYNLEWHARMRFVSENEALFGDVCPPWQAKLIIDANSSLSSRILLAIMVHFSAEVLWRLLQLI